MPGVEEAQLAVLDASVAVRWLVPERGSGRAAELLNNPITWLAPRLLPTEVAAALRRNVVAGNLRAEFATAALDVLLQMPRDGLLTFADDENLVASALSLALTVDHKLPDGLYLALAEREGAALATADAALARLAERRNVRVYLVRSG
ncbi:MAG TPA: type II toxin-antitoxin system VapC family toxin [Candidatus Cybelea sp.]